MRQYLFSEIILKFTNRFAYLMLKTIEYKYILVTNHSEAYYRKHYLLTIYRQPKSKNVNFSTLNKQNTFVFQSKIVDHNSIFIVLLQSLLVTNFWELNLYN